MRPRSMPASFARRRANGEAKVRLVPPTFARTPSPQPSPLGGEGALGARGEAVPAGSCAGLGATPSPRRGEGWGEGDGALAGLAPGSAGIARDSAGLAAAGAAPFPAAA